MSTLTKIVIVLLMLTSFFLCGSVVVYVGTAENYKEKYTKSIAAKDAAEAERNAAVEDLKDYKSELERQIKKLNEQITFLTNEKNDLSTKLIDSEREVKQLTQRIDSLGQSVEQANLTAEKQTDLFKQSQTQLKETEGKLSKMDTENKQLTDTLIDKEAIISTLEKEKKSLLEDKTELLARINKKLLSTGTMVSATRPVTVSDNTVRVTPREPAARDNTVRDINLQGVIEDVKLQESMVVISIGAIDGVRVGMEFFVIRGDEFICKIEIIDVEDVKAVGKLKLVQQEPRKGDVATTNL